MGNLNLNTLKFGEALTRMEMKNVRGGSEQQDVCGPSGPMTDTFCITGDQGDDPNPCTPGWRMGGLACPDHGICCSLLAA